MKNILFWVSEALILIFWPISFFLANSHSWNLYLLSLLVVTLNWYLYFKKFKYHYFVFLLLPIIHPAFLFIPIITILFWAFELPKGALLGFGALLLVVFLIFWKAFFAFSIFTPDPLANDTLVKKITLIPNRQVARVFENKTTIFIEKFKTNVFESLDLNNFFFGSHPQEVGGQQNLTKFSYLALVPFLLGLFYLNENAHKKWLLSILFSVIISIALINNQDRFNTLLFLPISLICLSGLKKIMDHDNQYLSWLFSIIFIPLTLFELVRILLQNG